MIMLYSRFSLVLVWRFEVLSTWTEFLSVQQLLKRVFSSLKKNKKRPCFFKFYFLFHSPFRVIKPFRSPFKLEISLKHLILYPLLHKILKKRKPFKIKRLMVQVTRSRSENNWHQIFNDVYLLEKRAYLCFILI